MAFIPSCPFLQRPCGPCPQRRTPFLLHILKERMLQIHLCDKSEAPCSYLSDISIFIFSTAIMAMSDFPLLFCGYFSVLLFFQATNNSAAAISIPAAGRNRFVVSPVCTALSVWSPSWPPEGFHKQHGSLNRPYHSVKTVFPVHR